MINQSFRTSLFWLAGIGAVLFTGLGYSNPPLELKPSYVTYVEKAQSEIALLEKDPRFRDDDLDVLRTQIAILESRLKTGDDFQKGVHRATRIGNPFYASLALGGLATINNPSPQQFRLALDRTSSITHYTGTYPNSMALLIGTIPIFGKDAVSLLGSAQEALEDLRSIDSMPGEEEAILALSQVIATLAPEKAESFLFQNGTRYWDSARLWGTFFARKSVEEALRLAEKVDEGHREYFLGSVLAKLAKTDFPRAFRMIKEMREFGRQSAAEEVATTLAEEKRYDEVQEIINYLDTLKHNWKEDQFARIRRKMAPPSPDEQSGGVDMIDDFLTTPDSRKLEAVAEKRKIAFRDREQVAAFIVKALPLASQIWDMGYPDHGSPHSSALGLLFLCSALTHESSNEALEIVGQIEIPELRAACLLNVAEAIEPLPPELSEWPIRFWPLPRITILQ